MSEIVVFYWSAQIISITPNFWWLICLKDLIHLFRRIRHDTFAFLRLFLILRNNHLVHCILLEKVRLETSMLVVLECFCKLAAIIWPIKLSFYLSAACAWFMLCMLSSSQIIQPLATNWSLSLLLIIKVVCYFIWIHNFVIWVDIESLSVCTAI